MTFTFNNKYFLPMKKNERLITKEKKNQHFWEYHCNTK